MANITSTITSTGTSIAVNAGKELVRPLSITASNIKNAGTFADDDTVTFEIPVYAGEILTGVSVKLGEAFDGSGNQLNLTAGNAVGDDEYIETAALHTTQTEISTVYNTGDTLDGTTSYWEVFTADDKVYITLDGSAGSTINLGSLTAGEVTVNAFIRVS